MRIPKAGEAAQHALDHAPCSSAWRDWTREWTKWDIVHGGEAKKLVTPAEFMFIANSFTATLSQRTVNFDEFYQDLNRFHHGASAFQAFGSSAIKTLLSFHAFEKEFVARTNKKKSGTCQPSSGLSPEPSVQESMEALYNHIHKNDGPPHSIAFEGVRDAYALTLRFLVRLRRDGENQLMHPLSAGQFQSLSKIFYPHMVRIAAVNRRDNMILDYWFQSDARVFSFEPCPPTDLIKLRVHYPDAAAQKEIIEQLNGSFIDTDTGSSRQSPKGHFGCPVLQAGGVKGRVNPIHTVYWDVVEALKVGFWPEAADNPSHPGKMAAYKAFLHPVTRIKYTPR